MLFTLKVSKKLIPTKKEKEKKLAALGLKCWKLNKKGKKQRDKGRDFVVAVDEQKRNR